MSCPIPSSSNFVQDISRILHNDLVIKIPKKIQTSAPSKSALPEHQPKTKPGDVIFPWSKNIPAPATSVPPVQPNPDRTELGLLCNAVIARGSNEKWPILDEYKQKFGKNYSNSIVSKKKGKITDDPPMLTRTTHMRPSLDKWYWVSDLTILNVIRTVIKEHCLRPTKLKTIRLLDKNFSIIVPKVAHWLKIDFYPLCEPRYNYKQQECIDTQQVDMASAAMIHFGLDLGKLVCFLGEEYRGYFWDIQTPFEQFETMFHPKIWHIWNTSCWMAALLNWLSRSGLATKWKWYPEAIQKASTKPQTLWRKQWIRKTDTAT